MAISLTFFNAASDLDKFIDEQLIQAKDILHSYSTMLEETRKKFDDTVIEQTETKKLKKSSAPGNVKKIDIEGFKILVNPSLDYEMKVLDEAILAIQERIAGLEKAKKNIIPLLKKSSRIIAIFDENVPTAFMYREEPHLT